MNKPTLLAVLFCLLFSLSCDNVDPFDIDDVDFGDPAIGVPLVNSTFYIADIGVNPKNNTDVIADSEGRVTLRYSDRLNPVPVSDVYPTVEGESSPITESPQNITLPFHDVEIQNGEFKNTRINFQLTNPENEVLFVTVSIPEIQDASSGQSFTRSYQVAPNAVFSSPEEELTGMMVASPQGHLTLSYSAETATLPSVILTDMMIHYTSLDFSYLEGIFDNSVLPTTEDLIDISFFDSWVSGGLDLSDPKLIFEINNSIGIPAEMKLNYATITTIDDETFELESDLLKDGISFDYPDLNSVGSSAGSSIEINGDNSNVADLFEKKPKGIDYDLDLSISSGQNEVIGFYNDESNITVDAVVELPLYLRANDLVLQDTIAFEEIEYDDIEGTGQLKLSLINSFPIGVSLNLYFLDDQGETLFSLVDDNDWISVPANTDFPLTVDDIEPEISSIPIAEDDVLKIPQINNVLVRLLITTTEGFDDEFVWFYDHHGIDIKLGAVLR